MKNFLTLVLCWLLAFSAMAETTSKAKTAASVAGGYVTSLNRVDGSFEDEFTQWSASVGTIVPTASTEFQGNKYGLWSGTGTGALDLQWTATASNTYEASAQVDVQGEDDVYVCAYVGTTETGCKLIPALSKIQKVSVVADSVMSSAFYLRLKHTGSDAFNVKVDDGKIEPWTPQAVNLVEQESVRYGGANLLTTTGVIRFSNAGFNALPSKLFSYDSATGYFTPKKKIVFSGVASLSITTAAEIFFLRRVSNNAVLATSNTTPPSTSYFAVLPFSVELSAGESVYFGTNSTLTNASADRISITATAISENVVQSWQDGTEWTSYTPTFSAGFGTVTNAAGKWKRSGSDLEVFVSCTTGNPAASLATVSLPSGLSIDSSKLTINNTTSNPGNLVGTYNSGNTNTGMIGTVVTAPATSTNLFYFGASDSSTSVSKITPANANGVVGNSIVFTFYAKVPIAGWSSTPTLYALPTRSEVFSANIAAAGTVTNATQNFVTSCTNAAPSVCSLWSNFGVTPICWAHATDIAKRAEVSSSTATTTTVARTDTGTAFNLFCHLK